MYSLLLTLACLINPGIPDPGAPIGARLDADTLHMRPAALLAGAGEDRLRVAQIRGAAPTDGFLLRSLSTLMRDPGSERGPGSGLEWTLLSPEFHLVNNSALPFSQNEGPLWAGRGQSMRLTLGGRLRLGPVEILLAPQFIREQNLPFQIFSYPETPDPGESRMRHPLANPFHYPPRSMDLPLRHGEESRTMWDPGQSSVTVSGGPVAFGWASENLWWGPGMRNGLIMSSQAPGFHHIFLRTGPPVRTRIGEFEGRWILGRLEESEWFDFDPTNDHRSLSALAFTFSPAIDERLTVGVARAVYAPADADGFPFEGLFDVFRGTGRPAQAPGDSLLAPGPDQLFSLFARWVFPESGFEVYGEWGRAEQPHNVRDLMVLPQHSRGYTFGFQYVQPSHRLSTFRIQGEITQLEPSTSFRVRSVGEWYASRRVPQGYTHRGRVIGAAIGPSGSSQWIAGDLVREWGTIGLFFGRIRWENEAQFSFSEEFRRADVTIMGGVRGGARIGPMTVYAEYSPSIRLNYLFQARPVSPSEDRGVDIRNHTVKVTLSAAGRRFP